MRPPSHVESLSKHLRTTEGDADSFCTQPSTIQAGNTPTPFWSVGFWASALECNSEKAILSLVDTQALIYTPCYLVLLHKQV